MFSLLDVWQKLWENVKRVETTLGILERLPLWEWVVAGAYAVFAGLLAYLQDADPPVIALWLVGALIALLLGLMWRESMIYRRSPSGLIVDANQRPYSKYKHPRLSFWALATVMYLLGLGCTFYFTLPARSVSQRTADPQPPNLVRAPLPRYPVSREAQNLFWPAEKGQWFTPQGAIQNTLSWDELQGVDVVAELSLGTRRPLGLVQARFVNVDSGHILIEGPEVKAGPLGYDGPPGVGRAFQVIAIPPEVGTHKYEVQLRSNSGHSVSVGGELVLTRR